MILTILNKVNAGFVYARQHPNLLLALVLVFVLPLLFLYSNQKYLEIGQSNQDRLQKDRVGIIQDLMVSTMYVSDFNLEIVQSEIDRIAELNSDIIEFRIDKRDGENFVPVVALNQDLIGQPEKYPRYFQTSMAEPNRPMTFMGEESGIRMWHVFRPVEREQNEFFFIYTKRSMYGTDQMFANARHEAWFSLVLLYVFVLALAYWQIKQTDYRYLYVKVREANEMKDLF